MYYAQQLRAHGWQVDDRAQVGPSGSISARRSSLFYGVDYAPDGQLTISLSW